MPSLTLTGSPTFNADGSCLIDGLDRVQAPASLMTMTQGWFAVRVRMQQAWNAGQVKVLGSISVDANNGLFLYNEVTTGQWALSVKDGGVTVFPVIAAVDQFSVGDQRTVIGKWTSTNGQLSLNGSAFETAVARSAAPSVSPLATFDIGASSGGGLQANADIHWFIAGRGTLTDADAATLHRLGNADPTVDIPGSPVLVWQALSADYFVPSTGGSATIGSPDSTPVLWNAPQRPEFPQAAPPPAWNNASD